MRVPFFFSFFGLRVSCTCGNFRLDRGEGGDSQTSSVRENTVVLESPRDIVPPVHRGRDFFFFFFS